MSLPEIITVSSGVFEALLHRILSSPPRSSWSEVYYESGSETIRLEVETGEPANLALYVLLYSIDRHIFLYPLMPFLICR